tara:strand:- start:10393 stop:14253 length:3861 start_codon:yes stop_codon:yes gene_type:complete
MPKFGGSSAYKNYLYLLSADSLLSIDNQNLGADLLRRVFGSFYYYATEDGGEKTIRSEPYTSEKVENLVDREIFMVTPDNCEQIQYAEVNPARIQVINENVDIPNLKIPIRLYADKDNSSVKGDYHWKQFMFGGEYGGQQLPKRLNSDRIYYDSSFVMPFALGYQQQRAYEAIEKPIPTYVATYNIFSNYDDYNFNVHKYQEWSKDLESELLMPNFYIINDYYHTHAYPDFGASPEETAVDSQLSFVSNKSQATQYHFPAGNYWLDLKRDEYFGDYFTDTRENAALQPVVLNSMQNIILDQHYFEFIKNDLLSESSEEPFKTKEVDGKLSSFFNVQIKFDRNTNGVLQRGSIAAENAGSGYTLSNVSNPTYQKATVRNLIKENNFSSRMLEILKDIDEGTIDDVPKKRLPFNYCITKDAFSYVGGAPSSTNMVIERPDTAVGLHSVNFMDFLAYMYNNYDVALNDNYIFAGPSSPARAATMSDDTFYRTLNSKSLINMIDGTKDLMKSYMKDYNPGAAASITESDLKFDTYNILSKLYGPGLKRHEVLAYKVEKIAGPVTGDSSNQNIIQKFWIFNSPDAPAELSVFDSQVKYGKDYTYKITAYTLVLSHKYKYGDFRLTKQIGAANHIGGEDTLEYCLQFYDPETNMIAPQLFASADLTLPEDSPLRTVISGMNRLAPNSVEISRHPQLLDFHLYIEPCMELIEVPIYQKTIKVMDNPCNSINVSPFHFIDNSSRVGFQVMQESFIKRPYPEIIDGVDLKNKSDYMRSKEIEPYNLVDKISQSPARYIEMYRIKNKPNAFADFKDSLVATVDLRIKGDTYNFKNKIVSDQIATNTVYYYVFRFVNENGVPGPLSQIIQCELVDDGGYTYALFDTVDSSEFNPNQVSTNSLAFKKLIQFDPNIHHLYFDDSGVDYEDYALNQISNLIVGSSEQKIWNKKFKIRLTSKKTSKKLDLNISYNTVERNLSKSERTAKPPTDYMPDGIPTSPELDDPPIVVLYDTGAGTVEPVPPASVFGVSPFSVDSDTSIGSSSDVAADSGGATGAGDVGWSDPADGAPTYTPIPDRVIGLDDLLPKYFEYGLRTQGAGFPATLYDLLAKEDLFSGAVGEAPVAGGGGFGFIKNMISDPNVYESSDSTFTPEAGSGEAALAIANWVYGYRGGITLAPVDKRLAMVSCFYLINLIPAAHASVHSTIIDPLQWTSEGEKFQVLAAQIAELFSRRSGHPFGDDSTYKSFEESPFRPPDFVMSALLANLGLPAIGLFEALEEGVSLTSIFRSSSSSMGSLDT